MESKNEEIWNRYMLEAKSDIALYSIIAFIISVIVFIFCYRLKTYFGLIIELALLIPILGRIYNYNNLKKIKRYIEYNQLNDKIGTIEFWNLQDYILTEYYMIIIQNTIISHFSYADIKEIYKKTERYYGKGGKTEKSLIIKLKDSREYKVLIDTTYLVAQECRDISDYLLSKNSKINVTENK